MAIEKMTLVNIYGKREKIDEVIFKCADNDSFHPEVTAAFAGKVKGFTPLTEENPYSVLLTRMDEIAADAGFDLPPPSHTFPRMQAQDMGSYIEDFRSEFLKIGNSRASILRAKQNYESALITIQQLGGLGDISLDDIFACKYLDVRFGKLPLDGFKKLEFFEDHMFIYIELGRDKEYSWGLYFTTEDNAAEVDDIFDSLYFERVWIPDFVHGKPEYAIIQLKTEIAAQNEALDDIAGEIRTLVLENSEKFKQVYAQARYLDDSFDTHKYVTVSGEVFHIEGYVPTAIAAEFVGGLNAIDTVKAEPVPEDTDKRLTPPTKLRNNILVRPFEVFVEMYGLPAYGGLDPTPFLAVTFSFLFGIMFGDVGQGILLFLLGGFLQMKKVALGGVINRLGVASTIFGFVYGSVFGFEEALDPLYHSLGMSGKPVSVLDPLSTNFVLLSAVGIGAFLLLITMLMQIGQAIKRKDIASALLSQNGIVGLVFYSAVLAGIALKFGFNIDVMNPLYIAVLIVFPLLIIFLREPLTHMLSSHDGHLFEDGVAAFAVESFFELFEVLLSFVTNTMSFLRVGGFAMIHAGMMAVVFTLAEMMGGVGNLLIIILGNLFVMAMEALLSGIQVLRLQYYELFSRYYEGNGKPFRSITAQE